MERLIFDLTVYCPYTASGCGWTGELRDLDKHISPSKQGGCLYVEVECCHGCGQKMMRSSLNDHERETCSKLPVEVQMKVLQERVEKMCTRLTEEHQKEIACLKAKISEQEEEIKNLKVTVGNSSAKSEAHSMTYAHLKRSALEIMPKLRGGAIPGVHYHASTGRVEIYGSNEAEVTARGYRFQLEYQHVILSSRSKYIPLPSYTDQDELLFLVTELNQKYDSTYLFTTVNEGQNAMKIISVIQSQFDEVVRLVEGKLKDLQLCKIVLASGRKVMLKRGDITKEDVNIIVTTSNRTLQGSSGVSWALNKATNGELQKISDKYVADYGKINVGDVAVTNSGGGTLKCKYVFHFANPKSSHGYTDDKTIADLLHTGITQALREGIKLRASSIAIPAVSSGAFVSKNSLISSTIIKAITGFDFGDSKALKDIRIIIRNQSIFGIFAEHFQKDTSSTMTEQ
ncbi:PREDICTED: uncharacterized protein LOC109593761 [Amphimedon queenslandica]|uniref:Macro domain-containing protein n=1 Tax=Amphimedon queenslandica TaxID=400682 RepID=A0A1X7VMP3_AMPQE|nr:PREDICTED: uncharacterized protein LOC109593761 [Amphimedon queenslandica]|eukprot:XP_019864379.1 PREDICTED: uncharacterized protein LOC109593761 [Amphimedon queenslandica]